MKNLDIIGNILGSLLSSDLYENWLSVIDEKSLIGKISAIQSISIIQIMIDNYVDIFGDEHHKICVHNQKRSDDIKMSGNTAEQGTMKQHQHRTFHNGNFLMTEKDAEWSNLNKKRFKIKCILPLNNLWAVDNVELVKKNQTCPCKNIFLFWPDGNFLASFRSIEQKDHWYRFLRRSIDAAKKDIKKPFSLKIVTEDIPSCDSPLCVTTTNTDTVNDIIEKLLPMIRISVTGKITNCGSLLAMRKLQEHSKAGYECPHKILMIHLQNNFKRWNSKISTAFPILPGLFVKDLILHGEGQFILKPREARSQQQKIQEGNVDRTPQAASQTPTEPMKKQVFRTFPPIDDLDRMLPSPVLDMLSIIEGRGQSSDQIFRFVPEKSHWSLRDKIYTEQHIKWNEESVLTVASVLKDFIRNIQGSLLSTDLYENWLSVLDEKSLIGKISAIQSILLKMPQANYLLLKQLIRVLLKIKTSTSNNLDTYMLSVRTAPHVLWDPTCLTSLFGSDLSKKISIIEIMIDNYEDIFGDEDHIICDHNQKKSDDIKISVNTAVQGTMKQYQHRKFHNGNFSMTEKGADHSISMFSSTSLLTIAEEIVTRKNFCFFI
ncbi:Predicted gene 1527 [Apodemus speciosus]|uniref:Predicted gene 1527 n=1 Tax=Apodemus speciosus TaxID=105296 RepID=A0ABQ0FVV7_APOSI